MVEGRKKKSQNSQFQTKKEKKGKEKSGWEGRERERWEGRKRKKKIERVKETIKKTQNTHTHIQKIIRLEGVLNIKKNNNNWVNKKTPFLL